MIRQKTRAKVWQAIFDRARPVGPEWKGSVLDSWQAGQRFPNSNLGTARAQLQTG